MKLKLQGWRGPVSLGPPPLHYAARGPEASAALPSLPSPPPWPPKDAQKPPGVHSCKRLVPAGFGVSPWPRRRPAPTPRAGGEGAPAWPGFVGRRLVVWGRAQLPAVRVREGELGSARARAGVCRSPSPVWAPARSRGPPVSSFPVLSPGPHRVETGHLVKRCFWPSGRRGDRRRKAPRLEFFSIKSDKKFREK